jgi:hypothetical protein
MTGKRITALAALLAATAAGGMAAAQDGPMEMMGPMGMMGHGGIDFAAIDADGDGSLSRAELQARAAERIARADANGDGILGRDELIAAMPGAHGALVAVFAPDPSERYVDRLLALVGATESGQVEVTVLADRQVNMLLAAADQDRDAAISAEEAEAMPAHHRGERHGRRGRPDPEHDDDGGRGPRG